MTRLLLGKTQTTVLFNYLSLEQTIYNCKIFNYNEKNIQIKKMLQNRNFTLEKFLQRITKPL